MPLPPYTYECRDAAPGHQKRWVKNAVDIFNADPRDRLISRAEKQRILGELSRELTLSECSVSDNKNVLRLREFLQGKNHKISDNEIQFLIYHALLRQGLQAPNTPLWKDPVILAHEKPLSYLQKCALEQVTAQDEELKRLLPTPPFEKSRPKPSIKIRCKSARGPSAAAKTDIGDSSNKENSSHMAGDAAQKDGERSMANPASGSSDTSTMHVIQLAFKRAHEAVKTCKDTPGLRQDLAILRDYLAPILNNSEESWCLVALEVAIGEESFANSVFDAISTTLDKVAHCIMPSNATTQSSQTPGREESSTPGEDKSSKRRASMPAPGNSLNSKRLRIQDGDTSSSVGDASDPQLPKTTMDRTYQIRSVADHFAQRCPSSVSEDKLFALWSLKMWVRLGLNTIQLSKMVTSARRLQQSRSSAPVKRYGMYPAFRGGGCNRKVSMAHNGNLESFLRAKERLLSDTGEQDMKWRVLDLNVGVWLEVGLTLGKILEELENIVNQLKGITTEEQMKMHWGSEDLGVLDKWLDETDDEFFIDFSFIAWIGVITKAPTMLDPISGLFIGAAALMLAFYGPYVYWISHGPTLDEWRERELAADRRRLREVIREENRAADAAMLRQLTERAAEIKARKDMQMEKANGKDQSEKKTA
ncbi:hypothetical protein LX32DRAFT_696077 [Colletotrichum zoysiae]|uniref:Uncharacterized protein n=1 Tax=Colletotrichum zoysiae TaxID=1216348 RepID=A0AAD9HDB9_9PEZI|nr:hypothetical protein LX32DRAFT_696077 [Colletotrichum zoysiae]